MADVLNRLLYRRLARHFGGVKTTSDGEAMIYRSVRGVEDEPLIRVEHAGEYYRVNCPYCNDTRYRLYVNHMFGQRDGHGRRMLFLAVCYNEGCLDNRENQLDFIDRIDDLDLSETSVRKGVVVPEEAREVSWPGRCSLLSALKDSHPAKVYMRSRDFDPDHLAKTYMVSYCHESYYSLARDRIIIPIFEKQKLKGWQARHIGELDWKGPDRRELPPKYFSCPDSDFRSKCIYGLETMREWETGILVEGPTDRWRFGFMSGCIFGNTVTTIQRRKFLSAFRKRTGVLLLDPEEYESKTTQRFLAEIRKPMRGRFCAIKLPEGHDPGELDRGYMRAYVKEQAALKGVKVVYRKVA